MSDDDKKLPEDPDKRPQLKKRRSKRSEAFDLLAALAEPIAVRQDGKTKKVSSFEAGLRKQVMSAVAGKIPAIKYVLGLVMRYRQIRSQEPQRNVVVIPKDMPEEFQREIWEYNPDEDGQQAMQRIYRVYAKWLDCLKPQNSKKDADND